MRTTSLMALPSSVLAGIFLFALTSAQKDNGNECSCFLTNGSSSGYFSYHRFHDFRNVAGASATPPTVISNENNATEAFATSDFFLSDAWQNDWQIQNWNNSDSMSASGATVLLINSANNIYIGTCLSIPQLTLFLTMDIRAKQRYRARLHLLPHVPHLSSPRLPVRRRSRLERKELPIPLRPLPSTRNRRAWRLRRDVYIPTQRQPTASARIRHRDPDRRPARHGAIHKPAFE